MPDERTFSQWAVYHLTLFGLEAAKDGPTVASWCQLFERTGFTPRELFVASDALALASEAPKWRTEHLGRLTALVRSARQEEDRVARRDEVSWPDCHLCHGSG